MILGIILLIPGARAEAGESDAKAQLIYDAVMARVTTYKDLNEPKVMAACIDWNAQNSSGLYVHNVFVTYTSRASDRPIFPERLANDAKYRCEEWKKSKGIDCTCQMLDMNGKNVLEVPPGE